MENVIQKKNSLSSHRVIEKFDTYIVRVSGQPNTLYVEQVCGLCMAVQWMDRKWEEGCTDNEGICVQRTGGGSDGRRKGRIQLGIITISYFDFFLRDRSKIREIAT